MEKLDTPDLCARLDTMKALCDRLEAAQGEPERYRDLLERIRLEATALRDTVCRVSERPDGSQTGDE